ncbi:terpenoid synthase [Pluteus cervinus]|uniref:Terpenoid synthase n=1 Tax=Pluteus cervinus TaxID=181527 RepID=A0ACD3B632_9AGAR|nr:terpenoid synthase [Pluteus cervinus]
MRFSYAESVDSTLLHCDIACHRHSHHSHHSHRSHHRPDRRQRHHHPTKFILPDLVSHCTYPLRNNPYCYPISRSSEEWFLEVANHDSRQQAAFLKLKAGELTASCYPNADPFHLRVCIDFMNFLFNLDDWLDEFCVKDTNAMAKCCLAAMRKPSTYKTSKKAGILTKSFYKRLTLTAGPNCQRRFIHSMKLFFTAVAQEARHRERGIIPDLEAYITLRRDTSGCKPCFQLIEFAAGIDLPDEVINHPTILALEEATNDLVTWSNDIFSYNVEQSRHGTHNMITVLMKEQGLCLQDAVDLVGRYCKMSIERFEAHRQLLPSWNPDLDRKVAVYIEGLQNWIVGSLHWSFDTERYFGKRGPEIKQHRTVELLPKGSPVLPGSSHTNSRGLPTHPKTSPLTSPVVGVRSKPKSKAYYGGRLNPLRFFRMHAARSTENSPSVSVK